MRNTDGPRSVSGVPSRRPLVIGCGALARELVELTRRAGLPPVDLTCLPASLHNRPERIPGAVAARIRSARADGYDRMFVAYADCGTGGMLDRVLEAEGVARLEGAHCYEVYAGRAAFATLSEEEPGTFYLTDFLVRNFDRLVVRGLGLDRHPELLPIYFGNYRRLVYLAQTDDAALGAAAKAAADHLGLTFERRLVGLGDLETAVHAFAATNVASQATNRPDHPSSLADGGPLSPFVDSQATVRADRQSAVAANGHSSLFVASQATFPTVEAGSSQAQARFGAPEIGLRVSTPEIVTVRQRSAPKDKRSADNRQSASETLSHRQRSTRRADRANGRAVTSTALSGTAA